MELISLAAVGIYGVSLFGLLRHTSTATTSEDYYLLGRYLTEGRGGNANRDTGLAIAPAAGTAPTPGDVDGNGTIDLADFEPIRANFRKQVTSRNQGDLTRDMVVNFIDFREWKMAFLSAGGSLAGVNMNLLASVPEPSTFALALLGPLASQLLSRRR